MKAQKRTINKQKFDRVWFSNRSYNKRHVNEISHGYEVLTCTHENHFYVAETREEDVLYWRIELKRGLTDAVETLSATLEGLKNELAMMEEAE